MQHEESANMPSYVTTPPCVLTKIFLEHKGFISDKWEQYLAIYESALSEFVEGGKPVRLLEIGVQNGGSLQIWSKYLPPGSTIVGIDIDPACARLSLGPNVSIRIGDAGDPIVLEKMLSDECFDIIIDDGSHRSEDVVKTFKACFGRVSPGGLYVVEDVHASYWASHGGGFRMPDTTMEYFKGLTDALHADYFESDAAAKLDDAVLQELRSLGRQIAQITFFDSVILIKKLGSEKLQPYRRVITGHDAPIVDVAGEFFKSATPLQLRTLILPPTAAASFAPSLLEAATLAREAEAKAREEIGQLRARLVQLEQEAARREPALSSFREQIANIAAARDRLEWERRALSERQTELERHLAELYEQLADRESEVVSARALLNRAAYAASAHDIPHLLRRRLGRLKRRLLNTLALRKEEPAPTVEELHAAELQTLRTSTLFDPAWYIARYPDVGASKMDPALHYLLHGAAEGRDPGPDFSTADYLLRYPDVAEVGLNPLVHYERYGRAEGRLAYRRLRAEAKGKQRSPVETVPTPWWRMDQPARILFISGEPHTPGHVYRVLRYAETARALGALVEIQTIGEAKQAPQLAASAHLVVLWRVEWDPGVEAVISRARRAGAQLLFDVDDLMFDPELARVELIDGIRSQGLTEAQVRGFYSRIQQTMMACDFGSVTTEALADHMRRFGKPVFVLPNSFDVKVWQEARFAHRARRQTPSDGLLRFGYAGGSRTHQRDFAVMAPALARILRERPECRLVLFRRETLNCLDLEEFPEFQALDAQVEWREYVSVEQLPQEIARFDVNLAPLEPNNLFCEAKSELKFFEAALAGVPSVCSPTGPFRAAIRDGETALFATDAESWYTAITTLLDDAGLRERMARRAYWDVLWRFGPEQRAERMASLLEQVLHRGRRAARAFVYDLAAAQAPLPPLPMVPEHEIVRAYDSLRPAEVTVVIPLYNYAQYVVDALDSVYAQTLPVIDLVVVDDASSDASLSVAEDWLAKHEQRFGRALLIRNRANAGLGFTRNVGFANAETRYVLPLDADNVLLPDCAARCLQAIEASGAAFAYPSLQLFGELDEKTGAVFSNLPFDPLRLVMGNYIDATALVRMAAWASVGGYDHVRYGWEDYDFWCRLAERGWFGVCVPEVLARYRVHGASMLKTQTELRANKEALVADLRRRHPWCRVVAG
jgi:GT2 family glycosyltransferase/glycosyltransferase involved in cell wall biosynthesis